MNKQALAVVVVMDVFATMMAEKTEMKGHILDKIMANRTARSIACNSNEYRYKGMCCQFCPAGTHVSEHCTKNHRQGTCNLCTPGMKFTAHPNGMDACLSCRTCRPDDEVQVAACTQTADTKCQCKEGTYCIPNDTCDLYCTPCQSCAKGQHVKHACTATADAVCEDINPADASSTVLYVVVPLLLVAVIAAIVMGIALWRKKSKDTEKQRGTGDTRQQLLGNGSVTSNSNVLPPDTVIRILQVSNQPEPEDLYAGDESIPLSQEDKGHVVTDRHLCGENLPEHGVEEDHRLGAAGCAEEGARTVGGCSCGRSDARCREALTDQEWLQCYNSLKDNIPPYRWKELMRLIGLMDIDIEHIDLDHSDSREKHYQMFLMWRNQTGRRASMGAVFRALDEMKLGGSRENIVNDIMSKGIRIV